MTRIIEFRSPDEWEAAPGLQAPAELAHEREEPDLRMGIAGPDGALLAHAALWWTDAPPLAGERPGCIGGFDASGHESAVKLLDACCRSLARAGCTVAVGPMNGNTWRRYRWVVEPGSRPPFFLEPWNPSEPPAWWRQSGFSELSRYSSSRVDIEAGGKHDLGRIRDRLDAAGVSIRGVATDAYENELRAIHRLSVGAFSNNFMYTPLDADEFVAIYGAVKSLVRPEFVRVAEAGGEAVGFVFALPDALALARGDDPDLIVKTLAVKAERRMAGLGSVLVHDVEAAARARGTRFAIHALAHESNTSLRITRREGGEVIRRYALFSKRL